MGRLRENVSAVVARLARRPPYQVTLRQLIAQHAPGLSFVDVGCMWKVDGAYAFLAMDVGATAVTGLDLMPATAAFEAANAGRAAPVRFVQGDVNSPEIARTLGTFDVVFCSGVLYHVPNPVFTLARLRAACREVLILGSSTIPELAHAHGAVYYPQLDASRRAAFAYRTPPGYDKVGLDTAYRPEWDYANYFWGLTPSCIEAMLTSVGFAVVERHRWRHALAVVCRVTDLPPNFTTLAP
jgi:Methyltransferase domain